MSIQRIIKRNLPERAVYWGSPVNDGYGRYNYAEPVEIHCRWEDMHQYINEADGEQIFSRAVVYTNVDLQEKGLLYHGSLQALLTSGIDSAGAIDHTVIDGVFEIKRWAKIPVLGSTKAYLRKAYLAPYAT